ncbi:MAG TPA: hypothetical protein EYH40_03805 [Desulfurococcales archaeon]|nr:hypothetical protein [Desulfurococcales archaeon]
MNDFSIHRVVRLECNGETKLITIRKPRSPKEYRDLMKVQVEVWGMLDPSEITPYHVLIAANDHGGLVLGAYDENGRPLGFIFSFLGLYDGRLVHYSHMLGVVPNARFRGLGYHIKLAQRDYVLKQGLDLIVWTYDPLQSLNAKFNIVKLGAIIRRYYVNYYGYMALKSNLGLDSDRFKAEWWIRSRRVELRLKGRLPPPKLEKLLDKGAQFAIETVVDKSGFRVPVRYHLDLKDDIILVEIPWSINEIREKNIELARLWRKVTRSIFQTYLSRGYLVVDYVVEGYRGFYVLWRRDLESILRGDTP